MSSCSIERRHYRDGFYVDRHHRNATIEQNTHTFTAEKQEPSDVVEQERAEELATPYSQVDSVVVANCPEVRKENASNDPAMDSGVADAKENVVAPPDEPKPEKDAPNRTILILILAGILLVFAPILAILPISVFLFVLVLCMPAVAVLLYLLALMHRKKVLVGFMRGEKGKQWQLSNYYHRFSLALHLFFGSVLVGQVGVAVLYLTNFLGLAIGITFCAMILAGIMFIFLLIMALLYLFKWRKLGDRRPKSWEKRPKDG